MFDMQKDDSGVSPVIGVILMVAVTVALVALVTVVVFDLGGDVSDSPDATVQLEQGQDSSGNGQVTATILRNENVETLYLDDTGGATDVSQVTIGSSPGATGSITNSTDELDDGETVNVIAEMPDGTQEVLTSTEFDA